MKIIKSKYSTKNLNNIHSEILNNLDNNLLKKINLVGITLPTICFIGSVMSLVGMIITEASAYNVCKGLTLLFLILLLLMIPEYRPALIAFFEKRGKVLTDPLVETDFSNFFVIVATGEILSGIVEQNPDVKIQLTPNGKVAVYEKDATNSQIVKELSLFGYQNNVIQNNSDVLDFSCFDEELDTLISSAKEKVKKNDSENAGGKNNESN